jgi:hypothetical protein
MRELAKSVLSFSWALPLFGIRQAVNLIHPAEWTSPRQTTSALGAVTSAATGSLGGLLGNTFEAGDRLQRSAVDMVFSLLGAGGRGAAQPATGASPAAAGPPSGGRTSAPMAVTSLQQPRAGAAPKAGSWGVVPPGRY